MATIVVICTVFVGNVSAQRFYRYDYDCCCNDGGLFGEGLDFYVGFGAGAALVHDMTSPAFNVRLGMDASLFIAEIEGSYLSVNSLYDDGVSSETNTLSTMTVGANLLLKFLNSSYGHLALMLHTGYALQEGWYHDCCYDYYATYLGRYYIGAGINAALNLTPNISLFGEARYQSIPVDGQGENSWGGVFSGGIKIYF